MDREEMWRRVRDWRTPPEVKKQLLQMLHAGPTRSNGVHARGCSKCKKRLR